MLLLIMVVMMMMMKIMESSSNHHRNERINESTWIIMQHYEVTMGTLTPPLLLELAPENCYSTPQRSHLCAQSMVLSSACISPGRTGYTLWQGKITFIDDLPIWMPHLHRISHCHVWLPEGILSHLAHIARHCAVCRTVWSCLKALGSNFGQSLVDAQNNLGGWPNYPETNRKKINAIPRFIGIGLQLIHPPREQRNDGFTVQK